MAKLTSFSVVEQPFMVAGQLYQALLRLLSEQSDALLEHGNIFDFKQLDFHAAIFRPSDVCKVFHNQRFHPVPKVFHCEY